MLVACSSGTFKEFSCMQIFHPVDNNEFGNKLGKSIFMHIFFISILLSHHCTTWKFTLLRGAKGGGILCRPWKLKVKKELNYIFCSCSLLFSSLFSINSACYRPLLCQPRQHHNKISVSTEKLLPTTMQVVSIEAATTSSTAQLTANGEI